ncbi:hypothetical protein HOY80DRAFT_557295 [Tuber brumale]|nr:hypothetical protein HOY80DRAFT_557295 [Tuber brumale]
MSARGGGHLMQKLLLYLAEIGEGRSRHCGSQVRRASERLVNSKRGNEGIEERVRSMRERLGRGLCCAMTTTEKLPAIFFIGGGLVWRLQTCTRVSVCAFLMPNTGGHIEFTCTIVHSSVCGPNYKFRRNCFSDSGFSFAEREALAASRSYREKNKHFITYDEGHDLGAIIQSEKNGWRLRKSRALGRFNSVPVSRKSRSSRKGKEKELVEVCLLGGWRDGC